MDERACQREVVDLEVSVTSGGRSSRLFVSNLSQDGCLVEWNGEAAFRAGDAIHLDLPHGGTTEGTLVWSIGRTGGVHFATPLHEAVVKQLGFHPGPHDRTEFRDQFGRKVTMPATVSPRREANVSDAPEPSREQERATITVRCETRIGMGIWNFAILLDLSTHGFQLVRAPGCVVGAKVKLRIPGMEMLTATVKRMTAENIGCAFDRPLSPYVFEHLVATASAARIGER